MGLRRNRFGSRLGLVAVGATGAAVLLAAPPALAEPAGADVEFRVVGNTVVEAAGKPVFVQMLNKGPADANNIVVKVDISKVDTAKVRVDVPQQGCSEPDGGIFTCAVGSLVPGEVNNLFSPFDIVSVTEGATGSAGSFTVEVTSDTPDPVANEKVTVPLTVAPWGYDLTAIIQDVWAGPSTPVAPGATEDLVFDLINVGTATAVDPVWKVSLPAYVTFTGDQPTDFCTFNEQRTVASCKAPGLQVPPGMPLGVGQLKVKVAADAPGPAALAGGIIDGGALRSTDEEVPVDEAVAKAAAKGVKLAPPTPAQQRTMAEEGVDVGGDRDPSDNAGLFSVHVGANPADLQISATSGSGAVGATVKITVTIRNNGPASSPDTTVTVTAPTGTELVDLPTGCEFTTAGKTATCEGLLTAGDTDAGVFSFKIAASTVANDGVAKIEGSLDDPNPANNTAAIVITVDGGLPITGVKVTAIVGTGAAVLVAGVLLFMLARRRRVEMVAPSSDA